MVVAWLVTVLGGCCGKGAPRWFPLDPLVLHDASASLDLADHVIDDRDSTELVFAATSDPEVIAEIHDHTLTVTPQPGWLGETVVHLTAEDRCGNVAETDLTVSSVGITTPTTSGGGGVCTAQFRYVSPNAPTEVTVAGSFNDWSSESDALLLVDGVWQLDKALPAGAYGYKFVERTDNSFGTTEAWTCDPLADSIVCDADYKDPAAIGFEHSCTPGAASCNSLLVVEGCSKPRIEVDEVSIDRSGLGVHVRATLVPGDARAEVLLDDVPVDAAAYSDGTVTLDAAGLAPGRHTVRVRATDAAGNAADELYVPFWLDGRDWADQVLYFAFVDRMRNGDPANDAPTGASGADYAGGDLQGLIDLLPYLEDLGVGALWVSNLQDNAAQAELGDCDLTYSGYHAYWPVDARGVEEHFGDPELVRTLIEEAHARGMRVIMDLVANHVHEDHPYYLDHPEWFGDYQFCKDSVNGQLNFDRIPETCWFAPYLPDFDYSQAEPLQQLMDDAMYWATTYELDGFRVDAVKHVPYSVAWDLQAVVERRIEHGEAGGDEQFYTVGETFDGAERIASYIGPHGLSAQFDFPLYYAMRDVFAHNAGEVANALYAWDASRAAFGDAPMSTFLGNHDVPRFVTDAWVGGGPGCVGTAVNVASAPPDAWPYERIELGFTFLMTMPGVPLVYYGDELGLPGNGDPDNRQPLAWYAGDLAGVQSVDDVAARVSANQADVLYHMRALIHARNDHEALRYGTWTEWWREPDLVAYARHSGDDHALVVLNRSDSPRTLTNAVAFAGLPEGHYTDALTGQGFDTAGDSITVSVDPRSARVLVR